MTLSLTCDGKTWLSILLWSFSISSAFSFAQTRSPTISSLAPLQRVDHVDQLAREPAIVEHPDGTIFATGYAADVEQQAQTIPRLWKIKDGGATWSRVNVGGEQEGALATQHEVTIRFASIMF